MQTVTDFLKGKTLLVTGTTGFLGKGLVVQVLRHAPAVNRIYLPIRPRRLSSGQEVSTETRLEKDVIESSAFAQLRNAWGSSFDERVRSKLRVVAWKGLAYEGLGIEPETARRLQEEVDVVISSAAKAVFDEPIDQALEQNVLGAARVLAFAKGCRDAVFVHLSTAYVNGQMKGPIPEVPLAPDETIAMRLYDGAAPDYDLDEEIASIEAFSSWIREEAETDGRRAAFERDLDRQNRGKRVTDHRVARQLDAMKQRWIRKQLVDEGVRRGVRHGWHDSYTMTKAMGEQLIARDRGALPTAIVRPSIIESSLQDPEPGWIEGLKVADPLIAHFSKGRLADFPGDPNIVLDVIPVDIVANATLSVLPTLGPGSDLKVYHVATGSRNPVHLGSIFDYVYEYYRENPVLDRDGNEIPVQRWRFPSQASFFRRLRLYRKPVSAAQWIVDRLPVTHATSRWARKLSLVDATVERVLALSQIYSPYMSLSCEFETTNIESLSARMSLEDQTRFNTDVTRIDWREYVQEIHIPGLRRHVLKDGVDV